MLPQALYYASRGWHVFPLRGKVPRVRGGLLAATTETEKIERWWRKWPDADVGIATGPSGLVVLDPDDAEGLAELEKLSRENGALPKTLVCRTGRGLHLYYAGTGVRSTARGKLHVRGEGGYVVAPPSIHASGVRYRWEDAGALRQELPAVPDWVRRWRAGFGGPLGLLEEGEKAAPLAGLGALPAYLASKHAKPLASAIVQGEPWSVGEEARIRSALKAIPADNYEVWLQVGMGLHSQRWETLDGDRGFDLWVAWSEGCQEKFSLAACEKAWASFRRSGVGIGTVVRLAQQHGWDGSVEPLKDSRETLNGHALPVAFVQASVTSQIKFDRDKAGKIKATCQNAVAALHALDLECRHDLFHETFVIGGRQIDQFAGKLTDNAVHVLRSIIWHEYGFDPGGMNMHDATVQACLAKSFDPVVGYLEGLEWDGVRRLDTWLASYMQAADTPFNRQVSRLTLIAAVRRAREPGAKFDQITVLEGPEGRGKSTALELLAGVDNFSDQKILTLDDRAQQEAVQGIWIYEIGDLVGIRKAEIEAVKAFASRRVDRARPAYGRARVDRPRRCVLFATTNDETYLRAQTGNRRFWPVATGKIDCDAIGRDRDQLWAEAAAIEQQGGLIGLPAEHWQEAAALQDARRDHDPWEDKLQWVECKTTYETADARGQEWRIRSIDLFGQYLGIPTDRLTDTSAKRVAFIMRRLGWQGPRAMWIDGKTTKGFSKVIRYYED